VGEWLCLEKAMGDMLPYGLFNQCTRYADASPSRIWQGRSVCAPRQCNKQLRCNQSQANLTTRCSRLTELANTPRFETRNARKGR